MAFGIAEEAAEKVAGREKLTSGAEA